jgi:hypothetical protein
VTVVAQTHSLGCPRPHRRGGPVEFADAFLLNYPEGQWISRERERLASAIERAAGEDTGNEGISR